jgi:hypothetical protein
MSHYLLPVSPYPQRTTAQVGRLKSNMCIAQGTHIEAKYNSLHLNNKGVSNGRGVGGSVGVGGRIIKKRKEKKKKKRKEKKEKKRKKRKERKEKKKKKRKKEKFLVHFTRFIQVAVSWLDRAHLKKEGKK